MSDIAGKGYGKATFGRKASSIAMALAFIGTLFVAEIVARSQLGAGEPADVHRRESVRILSKDPDVLPRLVPEARSLLLIGNSHTYALPGLNRGDPLRPDPGSTLIDHLAAQLTPELSARAREATRFDRLSYPNFLPFEMVSRVAHLLEKGYRPRAVVLGITWRNIARERELRYQIRRIYGDPHMTGVITERLRGRAIDASAEVLEAIEVERRRAEVESQRDRQVSVADRYDRVLTDFVGTFLSQLGRSEELRASIYRSTINLAQARLQRIDTATYDVIESDLTFNLECIRILLRLLNDSGARGVVYWAPERADLPSLVPLERQPEVYGRIEAWARDNGFEIVDARDSVPSDLWGWERETPDRSHFTEPGHERLAVKIVRESSPEAWRGLEQP